MAVKMALKSGEFLARVRHQVEGRLDWTIKLKLESLWRCVKQTLPPILVRNVVELFLIYDVESLAEHVIDDSLFSLLSANVHFSGSLALVIKLALVISLNNIAIFLLLRWVVDHVFLFVLNDLCLLSFTQISIVQVLERFVSPFVEILSEVGLDEDLIRVSHQVQLFITRHRRFITEYSRAT